MNFLDENMMREALRQAQLAAAADEVPVGALVARDGEVLGAAHNQRETLAEPTAHAEIIAITQAASALGSWRLSGCTLYVTLEPCAMCAGAIVLARLDRVVYGATDPKAGAVESLYHLLEDARLNHQAEVVRGVLGPECGTILKEFFQAKRRRRPAGDSQVDNQFSD